MLEAERVIMIEVLHNYWGSKPPNTHINGNMPVNSGEKSPGLEVTQFCMLPFVESPGDHRS